MAIRSKEQAYSMIDPEEQTRLLADVRDELYQGDWRPMIADMEDGIRKTINPQTKYILQRDLELIAKVQRTE
jgi:hypothetical protein